ncbi:MAG: hypothetical protein QOE53_2380, partial [Pseudonocardiales bacterium]|nr:hypothetical protein [Pseudonocardiales bacterium]
MLGSGLDVGGDSGDLPPSRLAVAGTPASGPGATAEDERADLTTTFSESVQPPVIAGWTDPSALEPAPEDAGVLRRSRWLRQYQRGLVVTDLASAWTAIATAYLLRFGLTASATPNALAAVLLPLGWVVLIGVNHGYGARLVGVGAAEFQRIFRAFLHTTALIAFISFATDAQFARGFILVALPLALCLNLLARYAARKWLHAQRAHGRAMKSVLLVGDAEAISKFSMVLRRDEYAGLRVVGACVPSE